MKRPRLLVMDYSFLRTALLRRFPGRVSVQQRHGNTKPSICLYIRGCYVAFNIWGQPLDAWNADNETVRLHWRTQRHLDRVVFADVLALSGIDPYAEGVRGGVTFVFAQRSRMFSSLVGGEKNNGQKE